MSRALAALVIALLATGCGGKSHLTKSEYAQRVTAIYRTLGNSFRNVAPGRSATDTSAALRKLKRALDQASAALAKLDPPNDAAAAHRALLEAMRDYAMQVDLVRASVDLGSPGVIASHLREVTAPDAVRRALRELAAKGYRIPVTVASLR